MVDDGEGMHRRDEEAGLKATFKPNRSLTDKSAFNMVRANTYFKMDRNGRSEEWVTYDHCLSFDVSDALQFFAYTSDYVDDCGELLDAAEEEIVGMEQTGQTNWQLKRILGRLIKENNHKEHHSVLGHPLDNWRLQRPKGEFVMLVKVDRLEEEEEWLRNKSVHAASRRNDNVIDARETAWTQARLTSKQLDRARMEGNAVVEMECRQQLQNHVNVLLENIGIQIPAAKWRRENGVDDLELERIDDAQGQEKAQQIIAETTAAKRRQAESWAMWKPKQQQYLAEVDLEKAQRHVEDLTPEEIANMPAHALEYVEQQEAVRMFNTLSTGNRSWQT